MHTLEELADRLQASFPQLPPVAPLTVLGEGFSSLVVESRSGVVFRIAKNALAQQGHRREWMLLPAIGHVPGFKLPDPTYYLPQSAAFPYGFIGYRKLPGRPLTPQDITPESRDSIARQVAAFIGALHRIRLDQVRVGALPEFPSRPVRLREVWGRVAAYLRAHLRDDEYTLVHRWWRDMGRYAQRHPSTPTLVHGDLWYENVLFDPDTRRIVSIIDFEHLAIGDGAIDLATQRYLGQDFARAVIRHYYGGQPSPTDLDERLDRLLGLREVLGLEYGILVNAVDSDTLDKIRRAIIDPDHPRPLMP